MHDTLDGRVTVRHSGGPPTVRVREWRTQIDGGRAGSQAVWDMITVIG